MKRALPAGWDLGSGVVAGVDIGGTQCSVNVGTYADGQFELVSRDQFATRASRGPGAILAEIEARLQAALGRRPGAGVIGISCGGPLDAAGGIVQSPPNLPGWDGVPITARLQESFGLRCLLENDANASAQAEWAYGAGRGATNLVYLTFGTGLGAGMIIDGAVYRGAGNLAGEVGHWRIGPDTGPRHYGKRGSFEGFCSGSGIVKWYRHFGGLAADDPALSAELIGRRARAGDEVAGRVFGQAARQLGRGLAILADALAPELLIVGGIYGYATDLLETGMWAAFTAEGHAQIVNRTKIVPGRLGREAGSYASCTVALAGLATSMATAGGS